jgi:hypothetical protein
MPESRPGVLLIDDRRIFVAANEEAAELLAAPVEELVGRRTDDFMPLVARPLYPVAWQGFLLRGKAAGEYAAQRPDGSLRHLAYVGFANRPVRGLHFFVLRALEGEIDPAALLPRPSEGYLQVGFELSDEARARLLEEADREEWRLPVAKGGERAVLAALFDGAEPAMDALDALRALGSIEASLASAAGATATSQLTLLAGRVPYSFVGSAMEAIRARGGRIMANVDERWTGLASQ